MTQPVRIIKSILKMPLQSIWVRIERRIRRQSDLCTVQDPKAVVLLQTLDSDRNNNSEVLVDPKQTFIKRPMVRSA